MRAMARPNIIAKTASGKISPFTAAANGLLGIIATIRSAKLTAAVASSSRGAVAGFSDDRMLPQEGLRTATSIGAISAVTTATTRYRRRKTQSAFPATRPKLSESPAEAMLVITRDTTRGITVIVSRLTQTDPTGSIARAKF